MSARRAVGAADRVEEHLRRRGRVDGVHLERLVALGLREVVDERLALAGQLVRRRGRGRAERALDVVGAGLVEERREHEAVGDEQLDRLVVADDLRPCP